MSVLLTSAGLETQEVKECFVDMAGQYLRTCHTGFSKRNGNHWRIEKGVVFVKISCELLKKSIK